MPLPPTRTTTHGELVRAAGAIRDFLMVIVGLISIAHTPPSIQHFADGGVAGQVWSILLLAGGMVSLDGGLRRRPSLETIGCFIVGGGFVVWTLAALVQPDLTSTGLQVACVLAAGAVGQIWRGVVVATRGQQQ